MKTLIQLIFCTLPLMLFGQTHIFDEDIVLTYRDVDWFSNYSISPFTPGDTIDGYPYFYLELSGNQLGGPLFRKDENRIYYRPHPDTTDVLVYDFSLNVGDTFRIPFFENTYYEKSACLVVDSLGTYTFLNGETKNMLVLHYCEFPNFNVHWIEGFGNIMSWDYFFYERYQIQIWCIESPSGLMYSSRPLCQTSQVEENYNEINVYPNPVRHQLFTPEHFNQSNYKIQSMSGQTVKEGILQGDGVDMSQLASGMYILELQKNNEIYRTKIIKL